MNCSFQTFLQGYLIIALKERKGLSFLDYIVLFKNQHWEAGGRGNVYIKLISLSCVFQVALS